MSNLTDRQKETLARGLDAFEKAARWRRSRSRALRGVAVLAIASLGAIALDRLVGSGASGLRGRGLPDYVEIIADDRALAAELELANACERIDRLDGRLVVVECVAPVRTAPRLPFGAGSRPPAG